MDQHENSDRQKSANVFGGHTRFNEHGLRTLRLQRSLDRIPAIDHNRTLRQLGLAQPPCQIGQVSCTGIQIQTGHRYCIKRFDIKGKEFLRTLGKYYIVDIGLRNYLLGFRNRDSGHAIENVVYFDLLCRGYDVAIGKVGTAEVDFIATKADEKLYVQVTESMESETVRARELAPLQKIAENYEKIVLSLNPGLDSSYEGIKSLNLIDWLLESK